MKEGKSSYEELELKVLELERILESKKAASESSETHSLSLDEYRDLIELSPEATLITDNTGKILIWNSALVKLTGFKRNDAVGNYLWDIQYQLATNDQKGTELRVNFKKETYRLLSSNINNNQETYDQKIECLDGTHKTVRYSSVLIDSQKGKMLVRGYIFSL